MWRVVGGGNPHWEGHPAKKMWSPLPVARRDPIRLPFLEVTPTTVLERLRGQTPKDTSEEDRSPLALWSAEPIDLARTAPADFGSYRGVQYLGKLRQGSALSRSVNSEKGFALLPNKYASGGVGSARANERGGLGSPPALSPVPRRLYALEPLDQSLDGGSSGISPQTLAKIPPLRSAAKSGLVSRRIASSDHSYDRYNYRNEEEESEDDTLDEEDEEEEEGQEVEEEEEEEEIEDSEEFKRIEVADEAAEKTEKGSSACTRDSGISILSSNHEDTAKDSNSAASGRSNSQTPGRSSSQTSGRSNSQTPGRSSSQTSGRSNSQTPGRSNSQTPGRSSSQTSERSNSQTPGRSNSQTPGRSNSQTTERSNSQTTERSNSQTPGRSNSQTPGRSNTQTPERLDQRVEEGLSDPEGEEELSNDGGSASRSEEHERRHSTTAGSDPIEQEMREQSEAERRHSYETQKGGGLTLRGGRVRRGSTNSLPSSTLNVRQSINVQGKGISTEASPRNAQRRQYPGAPPTKIPNIKKTNNNIVFNGLDYESDFESDEEERNSGGNLSNPALTRMRILKKKRDTMREIERKLSEREPEEVKEQRIKRYRELEIRHSGSSLPITRPYSDPEEKSYSNRNPFSRSNSKPSPPNLQRTTMPKSRSHDQNLHLKTLTTEPLVRPHSLDRSPTTNKLPFSRAPTYGRGGRGSKPIVMARSPIITPTLPSYYTEPITSRRSTPGRGLDSVSKPATTLSEADIESVAFPNLKNYSTVKGRNFRAYPSPKDGLISGLELLKNNEWEEQLEGVLSMGRLATYHPEMLMHDLREINALLMKHAKNLRSQVSRTSIQVIMMFFDFLKKAMEPDLDKFVALLLHKTSDTNKFLKEDSNGTLDIIVEVITPWKATASIIQEGINHKSPQVKTTVARLLAYTIERLGAAKTLNQKEVAEKILPALTKLAQEGSLETRRYAKIAFQRLSTQPQFETVLKKYVSSDELRNIQKVLNTLGNERTGSLDTAMNRAGKGTARYGR